MHRYWGTPIPERLRGTGREDIPSLREMLFNPRSNLKDFMPERMRLVREITKEFGWGGGIYYVVRHLVPTRACMVERYQPRSRRDLLRAYGFHLEEKCRRAFLSMDALLRMWHRGGKSSH